MKSNCKHGQRLPPRLEITSVTRNPGHKVEKTKEETETKRKKKTLIQQRQSQKQGTRTNHEKHRWLNACVKLKSATA